MAWSNSTVLLSLCLLFACQLSGQYGPAGIGDLTSNGLWLRADAIAQADGSAVSSWPDRSAYGNDASQTTADFRPTLVASSALNGQPAVRLDGSDDRLLITNTNVLDGTPAISYFAVIRPRDLDGATPHGILGKRIDFTVNSDYAYTWFFYNAGNNDLSLDVNSNNNRFSSGTTRFANLNNYILSWDFDGARAQSGRARQYSGSEEMSRGDVPATQVNTSARPVVLGALNDDYRAFFGADYAEVIHYNFALSPLQRRLVNNYLSGRYAIPLTSGDVYAHDQVANGNYDFDIAGIGRISATDQHTDSQGSGLLRIHNPTGLDNNEYLMWGHDGTPAATSVTTDVPSGTVSRMQRVWRTSEVNLSSRPVDVGAIDLTFNLGGLSPYDEENLRLLVDTDGDGQFADEEPIGGARLSGAQVYTFEAVTALADGRRFTVAAAEANTLPVTLVSFTITVDVTHNGIVLHWQTAEEHLNAYFDVERSTHAVPGSWLVVGRVSGSGTKLTPSSYTYLDAELSPGPYYYRLRQVDFDGADHISPVVGLTVEATTAPRTVPYPNPTDGRLRVEVPKPDIPVRLFDRLGRDLTRQVTLLPEGTASYQQLDLSGLPPGNYVIRCGEQMYPVILKGR